MTKLEKKSHVGTFFGKSFKVVFRKIENFLGSRYPKYFNSPFSYQSAPKLLIYVKKIIKKHFRRIA
jgi:hypothetical protein